MPTPTAHFQWAPTRNQLGPSITVLDAATPDDWPIDMATGCEPDTAFGTGARRSAEYHVVDSISAIVLSSCLSLNPFNFDADEFVWDFADSYLDVPDFVRTHDEIAFLTDPHIS